MGWIQVFINRPIFLLMIEAFLIVLGIIGYQRLGVDQFPEIEPPIITVTTEYPGAGPNEVESLVTKPLEEEINQIGGIERLVSTSSEGISQIVVEFELRMDAKEVQTDVRDKVSRARSDLPSDVEEPLIQRLDFADRPILTIALREKDLASEISEARLRMIADQQIKPLLQKIDGVGQVDIFGGLEREIHIYLDQQKLVLWKLTPVDVSQAVRKANINIPAGDLQEEPTSRSLRLLGEYQSVAEIKDTVVRVLPGGKPITIADLGIVQDTFKERSSLARVGEQAVVLIEIKKESDANTVNVADDLRAALPSVAARIHDDLELAIIYDGARRIAMSVQDVMETLVIAAILAVIVVYMFLGSLQSTLITGISLPTTLITSFFALYIFGFTINVMTLLGLTLAVGLLLDDAIVVRENIWKKVEEGMAPKIAAFVGTKEVFIAVIATSLTVLATFIPVAFLPGIVGRFFAAFALTVCICVVLSTFDALTVAPTLSGLMVKQKQVQAVHKKPAWRERFGGFVVARFSTLLSVCLGRPGITIAASVLMFFAATWSMRFVGFTFLPADDSGEIEITIEAEPGATIRRTNQITQQIEEIIRNTPYVTLYSSRVGNELGEKNMATIFVQLAAENAREMSTDQVRSLLRQNLSGLIAAENLTASIGRPGGGGGPGKPIQAIVEGADVDQLFAISQRFIDLAASELPEINNVETNLKPGRSEIQMQVNRNRIAAFALDSERVGRTIRGLFEGDIAGPYREDGEEYDIRVQLQPEQRLSIDSLREFTIPNDRQEAVPLMAVTTASIGISPTKLIRIDQQRAVRLQADLGEGVPLGAALEKIEAVLSPLLPENYRLTFQGQAKSLNDLKTGALMAMLLGALFIYMVMASLYESLVIPFAILMTLPLAIIGAIAGLLITGRFLDIYSMIGIILLMGLVTKNAILLVDYAESLMREGMARNDALLAAGQRRLRPIMMTTIAMIAGMLPVAVGMGELNKVRSGMGIAAIGGLVSSTALSLVVVPCLYIYLDQLRKFGQRLVGRIYGA